MLVSFHHDLQQYRISADTITKIHFLKETFMSFNHGVNVMVTCYFNKEKLAREINSILIF